jgi:cytoskeleton protein RodZ
MTDESDKPQDATSQIDLIGPSGGERLAAARREQKVAIADIAKELHIGEEKVEALERNEFEDLGAPVFAKGYMRKYAQLVGLDVDVILSDYAELTAAVDNQPVIKARPRPRREMSPGPWIAVIVVIIAVVTAYWVFTTRPAWLGLGAPVGQETPLVNQSSEAGAGGSEQMAGEAAADGQSTAASAEDGAFDDEAADRTLVEQTLNEEPSFAPQEAAPEPISASPDNGEIQLLLTYSGDCWTEISDATGRRLYFGLGSDGRTVELSGTAPFDVLLGNANNVSLQLNGSVYVIDSIDRLGRARFSVAGN